MFRISVLYRNESDKRFDFDYYVDRHMDPNYTDIEPQIVISEIVNEEV